jgi:uncharacterized protein
MLRHYLLPIGLLIISNLFMTLAWYGHLKFEEWGWIRKTTLISVIFISWGLALFEYLFQVPANRLGYAENGGPYSLFQLKVIQEVITLVIFVGFMITYFENEHLRWNHIVSGLCLVAAVYFAFCFTPNPISANLSANPCSGEKLPTRETTNSNDLGPD